MRILDARRLLCPLPVIRVQDFIATLHPGELLEVYCTDPGALYDIPAWCRMNGHLVINTVEQPGECIITIRVGHGLEEGVKF